MKPDGLSNQLFCLRKALADRHTARQIRHVGPNTANWLRLLAVQPEAKAWQVQQADRALRVLFYTHVLNRPGISVKSPLDMNLAR